MKKKRRKYSLIRIARVLGIAGIMVVLYLSINLKANTGVKKINITLESNNKEQLISKTDILKYLNKSLNKDLEIEKIDKIDIGKIEKILDNSKYIKNSDVYIDSKYNLHINCNLRDPIVRIARKNFKDYYLDAEGVAIPISKRSTSRVPILNGNINNFKLSQLKKKESIFNRILEISKKIHSDPFLKALVEQLYLDNNNNLTLIPKLGRQKIEFGELTKIDDKLNKIKTSYKTIMPGAGWDKFEKLDLKWDGQIVLTKRD